MTDFTQAISRADGPPEITAAWLAAHRDQVHLVDIREAHELRGELGYIEGVEHVPMGPFLAQIGQRDKQRPTVVICRSGRRSAVVVGAFESAGYAPIASLQGGMIAWREATGAAHDTHLGGARAKASVLAEAIYHTNGVPEVSPDWVQQHLGQFKLVDCRQPDELTGPLGQLKVAVNVPLGQILDVAAGWDKSEPTVIFCRSGGRSARAALALLSDGFRTVASMEGGMIAWGAAGLPTD